MMVIIPLPKVILVDEVVLEDQHVRSRQLAVVAVVAVEQEDILLVPDLILQASLILELVVEKAELAELVLISQDQSSPMHFLLIMIDILGEELFLYSILLHFRRCVSIVDKNLFLLQDLHIHKEEVLHMH
tara:strand:+ start:307 stop:696 length:390 start_codon:yes stop_codon:yes gene_type:complete